MAVGLLTRKNQLVKKGLRLNKLAGVHKLLAEFVQNSVNKRVRTNFKRHLIVKIPPV